MTHPDFSGLWQANLEKSRLAGPPPQRVMVKIAQQDSELKQAILLTRADGCEERQAFTYSFARETVTELRGVPLIIQVRWNGPEMVIESRYGEVLFRDYWK